MIRLFILLIVISPIFAIRADTPDDSCANAYINIEGRSIFKNFELNYRFGPEAPDAISLDALLSGNIAKNISIPIAGFTAASERLENDFRELLKAGSFPVINISFRGKEIQTADTVIFRLGITIADTTKYYDVVCNVLSLTDNSYCIQGSSELLISDFGLKPPALIPGVPKVDEMININFSVTFETIT